MSLRLPRGPFSNGKGTGPVEDVVPSQLSSETQYAEWILNKIEKLSTGPLQGERVCTRGLENILYKIVD